MPSVKKMELKMPDGVTRQPISSSSVVSRVTKRKTRLVKADRRPTPGQKSQQTEHDNRARSEIPSLYRRTMKNHN